MSNITQFFSGGASGGGVNFGRIGKEVYVGPLSKTWTAPDTCTEVEFHVWGGGGGASAFDYGGGGGGGYVRHIYPISPGATFSITVGGSGGTSSVSCTSQSPTSPISATGGNTSPLPSGAVIGGTGGNAAFTIAPGVSTSYTLKYTGGNGGSGYFSDPAGPSPNIIRGGGGGSAGSPNGDGIDGGNGGTIGGSAGNGGAIENIFGTGSTWYYMSEFRSGNVSLANTSPNQAGAFNGGAGRGFSQSLGSPGGIGGGGAGGGNVGGGVGLVILYHN